MTNKPLKRHPSLVPVSQMHHDVLLLAQLLSPKMPIYKGLPQSKADRKDYAISFFNHRLKPYFKNDQYKLFTHFSGHDAEIDQLFKEISEEQELIIQLFEELSASKDDEMLMTKISAHLTHNIRLQERRLFQLIQQRVEYTILNSFKL